MNPSLSLFILHPGALGDLVSIFPLIRQLRRRFQRMALLAQGSLGRLAVAEELVDSWYSIESAWTASLFTGKPSAVARSILSSFASILAFSSSEALATCLRDIFGRNAYCLSARPPPDQRIHVADYVKTHFLSWGLMAEGEEHRMETPDDPENSSVRPEIIGARVVMLHPGAGSLRKRWPLEGYLKVAELLQDAGKIPQFIIGPAEEDVLIPILKTTFPFHCPENSIELLSLLRSASAYIGNDSGVSHLAAWVGVPAVVIFGPSDPLRWAPRGRSVRIVLPPLDCRPCFETVGENCDAEDCLKRLTAERVLDAYGQVAQDR